MKVSCNLQPYCKCHWQAIGAEQLGKERAVPSTRANGMNLGHNQWSHLGAETPDSILPTTFSEKWFMARENIPKSFEEKHIAILYAVTIKLLRLPFLWVLPMHHKIRVQSGLN